MNFDELSSPTAKELAVASACEINDLSDADLEQIFKHIPLLDRLFASEVCKRWHGISRMAWLDISQLDLSSIPSVHFAAIIKQCPNLRGVFAVRRTFGPKELHVLSRMNLQSVKLYHCTAVIRAREIAISDAFAAIFSKDFRRATWQELVLRDFMVKLQVPKRCRSEINFPAVFPASLKRLHLSGLLWKYSQGGSDSASFMVGLGQGLTQLQQLECLSLHSVPVRPRWSTISSLQNLRELLLCRSCLTVSWTWRDFMSLPRLETLFLDSAGVLEDDDADDFSELITKHPSLRILIMIEFPTRVRHGNGLNADPLPQLHIFLGLYASTRISFPTFPDDAAKVYPISEPLPEFLDREDIKPIFDGVWIAEMVKNAIKLGSSSCACEVDDILTSVRRADNLGPYFP